MLNMHNAKTFTHYIMLTERIHIETREGKYLGFSYQEEKCVSQAIGRTFYNCICTHAFNIDLTSSIAISSKFRC